MAAAPNGAGAAAAAATAAGGRELMDYELDQRLTVLLFERIRCTDHASSLNCGTRCHKPASAALLTLLLTQFRVNTPYVLIVPARTNASLASVCVESAVQQRPAPVDAKVGRIRTSLRTPLPLCSEGSSGGGPSVCLVQSGNHR